MVQAVWHLLPYRTDSTGSFRPVSNHTVEDRIMLSAFSRSLAPARPLRRALTLTVALALGALPVGVSAVAPHPQAAVAAVQPPRNNADTELR